MGLGLWGPRKKTWSSDQIRLSSPQPIPLASSIRILYIGQLILALHYNASASSRTEYYLEC